MFSAKGFLMLTMIIAGGLAASQAALNAQLSNHINSPIQASFVSFCIGALALALLLIGSQQGLPALGSFKQMPAHYLLGGLFGSVFITCAIFLVPRIGVVNVLFLGLAGQMIVSIIIDSFGLFGVKQQSMNLFRTIGLVMILSGVAFLKLSGSRSEQKLVDNVDSCSVTMLSSDHIYNDNCTVEIHKKVLASTSQLSAKRLSYLARRKHKKTALDLNLRRNVQVKMHK